MATLILAPAYTGLHPSLQCCMPQSMRVRVCVRVRVRACVGVGVGEGGGRAPAHAPVLTRLGGSVAVLLHAGTRMLGRACGRLALWMELRCLDMQEIPAIRIYAPSEGSLKDFTYPPTWALAALDRVALQESIATATASASANACSTGVTGSLAVALSST